MFELVVGESIVKSAYRVVQRAGSALKSVKGSPAGSEPHRVYMRNLPGWLRLGWLKIA